MSVFWNILLKENLPTKIEDKGVENQNPKSTFQTETTSEV